MLENMLICNDVCICIQSKACALQWEFLIYENSSIQWNCVKYEDAKDNKIINFSFLFPGKFFQFLFLNCFFFAFCCCYNKNTTNHSSIHACMHLCNFIAVRHWRSSLFFSLSRFEKATAGNKVKWQAKQTHTIDFYCDIESKHWVGRK